MKQTIITILLAFFAIVGQAQEAKFRMEGNIGKSDYSGTVHVIDVLTDDTIATAQVEDGMMQPVEGRFETIRMCRIVASDSSFMRYTLFLDEGTTHIDGVDEDGHLRLSGTPVTDDLNHFNLAIKQNVNELRSGRRNDAECDSIADSLICDIISRHADDMLGLNILTEMAEVSLQPNAWLELLGKIDSKFYENPKIADYLSKTKEEMETRARTWGGSMFVDFAVEYEGKTTKLSDYVGKGQYVLVDFWASWCGPCRAEIPNLIAAYNKHKDQGLQVLGIAAWDKSEATLKAIGEEKIPYPQIINSQEIATDLYGIKGIPEIILFAPDGKILKRGLRGENIEKELEKIFGE